MNMLLGVLGCSYSSEVIHLEVRQGGTDWRHGATSSNGDYVKSTLTP